MILVAFKVNQVGVDQSVLNVFVSKLLHDIKNVLGFVVWHSGVSVAESVEMYVTKFRVLQFYRSMHNNTRRYFPKLLSVHIFLSCVRYMVSNF